MVNGGHTRTTAEEEGEILSMGAAAVDAAVAAAGQVTRMTVANTTIPATIPGVITILEGGEGEVGVTQ